MTFDLAFGLGHETQAGLSPSSAARAPMPKEPAYHRGLSTLGRAPSSLSRVFAPGEVIGLFARGMEHEIADFRVAREQGLRVIQGLGGDLAGMVHAHQGRGFAPVVGRQGGVGLRASRGPGTRPGGRGGRRPGGPAGPAGRGPPLK